MADETRGEPAGPPPPNGDPANGEAAKWRRQLRDLEASLPGQLEEAEARGRAAMTRHVLAAEVRARAAGRFSDPTDALAFVGDDVAGLLDDKGMPNGEAIDTKLDELLSTKPHLAAKRPGYGSADQGARGGSKPSGSSGDWVRDLLARKA